MFATTTWIVLTSMVIVGSAFVLIALERRIPYDSRQRLLRKGLIEDLVFYGLLQSYVLAVVIATLIERTDGVTGLRVSAWMANEGCGVSRRRSYLLLTVIALITLPSR